MANLQGMNSVLSRCTTDWEISVHAIGKYLLQSKPISYGKIKKYVH